MAERTSKSGKKVVQADSAPKSEEQTAAERDVKDEADRRVREGTGWTASAEAKKSAGTKRVDRVDPLDRRHHPRGRRHLVHPHPAARHERRR